MDDAAETGEDTHMFESPGWIQDEDALRSALARAIKLEGLADAWNEIGEMCHGARFEFSHSDNMTVTKAFVKSI